MAITFVVLSKKTELPDKPVFVSTLWRNSYLFIFFNVPSQKSEFLLQKMSE